MTTHVPVRIKPISMIEFLSQEEQPTTKPYFWSRNPGDVIDPVTGESILDKDEPAKDNVGHWTLLDTIKRAANDIHKKALTGPGNFIVVNQKTLGFIEQLKAYKKSQPHTSSKVEAAFDMFTTAAGTLDNRYEVLVSNDMPKDKILIGLLGDGFKFIVKKGFIPEIDLVKSSEPRYAKDELSYWTYINVIGMN